MHLCFFYRAHLNLFCFFFVVVVAAIVDICMHRMSEKVKVLVAQSCLTLCDPCQDPPSMGSSSQEYWSELHLLLQGIFPTQESNPGLPPALWIDYLSHQGSPAYYCLLGFYELEENMATFLKDSCCFWC